MTSARGRRRGRPPGRVADLPPTEGHVFNADTRVGWLLRGWRLSVQPESNARGFATRLAERGLSADASRVSRWETGQLPAPGEVVEAYEEILDLPPGELVSIAAFQRRMAAPDRRPRISYPAERLSPKRVESMLETVFEGRPTGRDWFDFGLAAATLGESLILPRSLWREVAGRLVRELGLSVANAYLSREEGAVLLGSHAGGRRALVHAIGEHVTRPGNLLLTEPIGLLLEVGGPQANHLVLRLLEQDSRPIRNAAAWAASGKVARGQFGTDEMAQLERIALRQAVAHGLEDVDSFSRLADLVAVLPEESRERIATVVGPRVANQAARRTALEQAATDQSVLRPAGRPIGSADEPMFERLATLALEHRDVERRFLAVWTLRASTSRPAFAHQCAEQLRAHLSGQRRLDNELAHRLLVALSAVAGTDQRDVLTALAGSAGELRAMALYALAHLRPEPAADADERAADAPARAVDSPDLRALVAEGQDPVARAALYFAGMTGDPVLAELEHDRRLDPWRREAARWWLAHGPAIHEPTRP